MNFPLNSLAVRMVSAVLCGSALVACGGGGAPAGSQPVQATGASSAQDALSVTTGTRAATTTTTSATTSTTTTSGAVAITSTPITGAITDVRFESTDLLNIQNNVPVTFGQVFAVGNLLHSDILSGRLDDGTMVPLQVDYKADHPDGSVRHAVISAILPNLAPGVVRTMTLVKGGSSPAAVAITPSNMLAAGFTASVHALINGVDYSASADQLLQSATRKTWLYGGVVDEWQVTSPLKTADGSAHPHLTARFAVRWYDAIKKARVDMTIENDWAYEPNPQNFTYDATMNVGGAAVYTKSALTQYHHTRWRKVFWWNGEPQVNVKLNSGYLIASRALPNYDQTITVAESALVNWKSKWTGAAIEPMHTGLAAAYMPTTGGREDIGLLPAWASGYLLSMDKRAREVTLGTADLAGSWSAHYRDRVTDRPVSVFDHPYMTIVGRPGDTWNPTTKQYESFPLCAAGASCTTPNTQDTAHEAAFEYLPYLVTGDYYYLEELQFWAMYNAFMSNPEYRQYSKGLVKHDQVRGQAWSLRTLAEAAYITPDRDALKAQFKSMLDANLDWYNTEYSNNASANKLGVLVNGHALDYLSGNGIAPWQDDFFTSAVGHAAELGFDKAKTLLAYKTQFAIARMTAPGACWIDASIYQMSVRPSTTSPWYATMGDAYQANHTPTFNALECNSQAMATALNLKVGQMTGYADGALGYPSNLQPALAYAADIGGTAGKNAWAVFASRTVKPNYSSQSEFAIVPR